MALSDKQERFCEEYLIDFNATQAAIRAGYSSKTAAEQASRLLANVSVQEHLHTKKLELSEKTNITREKVLEEYAKVAFFDIRKIFTVDGGIKSIKDLDEDVAAAINGIENYDDKMQETGEIIGITKKVKFSNKLAALDSICRVLGFNAPDKKEVTGKNGEPIAPAQTLTDDQFNELLDKLNGKAKTN